MSGTKRHIVLDTNGLPHAILVTTANVTDREGDVELFENNKENLSSVKKAMFDGGYTGRKFAARIKKILGAEVEIAKRSELHTFAVIPKRRLLKEASHGLKSAADYGKIAKENLIPVFK